MSNLKMLVILTAFLFIFNYLVADFINWNGYQCTNLYSVNNSFTTADEAHQSINDNVNKINQCSNQVTFSSGALLLFVNGIIGWAIIRGNIGFL